MADKVAESIDPTVEFAHWRENFTGRPCVASGATFDDYGPAYQYGIESSAKYEGRPFVEAEPDLKREWHRAKGTSRLTWSDAMHAASDAWHRIRERNQ